MQEKTQLLSLTYEELQAFVSSMGESAFRVKQLYDWLTKGARFDEMSNLSKALREKLTAACVANPVEIRETVASKTDGTQKFLYALTDGNLIEGVLMRYHHGDTLCLSTQVGCKMGCVFCASTLEGCVRSLTPGEMLGQVIAVNRLIQSDDPMRRVHNCVLMGSGEPLDNYDNVIKFLRLLNDERGLNCSLRNVSLSTCGLVPRMYDLAREGLPVTLSVSLHAPNDRIRQKLMPIANVYTIDALIAACKNYIEQTGRRVIFEYALIKDVNCLPVHAEELASRLRGMQCHVNLIPLNDVKERALYAPDARAVQVFMDRLIGKKISVTRRREMGDDIQGACGQLRRSRMQETSD